jgi:predicted PurR-regulated permease PerM
MENRFVSICLALGVVALTIWALIIGQGFLQPLILAVVLWYLIVNLQQAISSLSRYGVPIPGPVAMVLALVAIVGAIWFLVVLVNASVNQLIEASPRYQARVQELAREAYRLLDVPVDNPIDRLIESLNIPLLARALIGAMTSLASELGLIVIYTAFLLLEYRGFDRKLAAMARNEGQSIKVRGTFSEISSDIKTYVRIKTTLGLLTALLCYAVMRGVGLQLSEFWAIVIFITYFIPTVGAIIGVIGPTLMLIVQFTSPTLIILVAVGIVVIESVMNNAVEPRLIGKSLNLSSLVIIVSLVFWGLIWGVLGMFLCVPLMVIINIVLAKFDATRPIAILLSADGNVDGRRHAKLG